MNAFEWLIACFIAVIWLALVVYGVWLLWCWWLARKASE